MNGAEKGLVAFKNKAMIERVIEANQAANHIAISCNRQQADYKALVDKHKSLIQAFQSPEFTDQQNLKLAEMTLSNLRQCISDQKLKGKSGPMAGILSYFLAWQEFLEGWTTTVENSKFRDALFRTPVVVSSCDMVLLEHKLIQKLLDQWYESSCSALFYTSKDQKHFLPFVIELGAALKLAQQWQVSSQNWPNRKFSIKNWLTEIGTRSIQLDSDVEINQLRSINSREELDQLESKS